MDYLPSFRKAKQTYKHWCGERLKVIKELESFRDEIQRQCRIHSIGSVTYSSVGIVGGGLTIAGLLLAPFTFGASIALTVAGVAKGVTSGVAGVTHGAVKIRLIKRQFDLAKESLENHQTTCKDLKKSLMTLKQQLNTITHHCGIRGGALDTSKIDQKFAEDLEFKIFEGKTVRGSHILRLLTQISGNSKEFARFHKLLIALEKILPSTLEGAGAGFSERDSNVLSVLVAIGIVMNLGTLIFSAVDLAKIEKGQLSVEATKLQQVIDEMDTRIDLLDECFQ